MAADMSTSFSLVTAAKGAAASGGMAVKPWPVPEVDELAVAAAVDPDCGAACALAFAEVLPVGLISVFCSTTVELEELHAVIPPKRSTHDAMTTVREGCILVIGIGFSHRCC